jgi:uncharacterized membrane protein
MFPKTSQENSSETLQVASSIHSLLSIFSLYSSYTTEGVTDSQKNEKLFRGNRK